jgi:hypothetical protein
VYAILGSDGMRMTDRSGEAPPAGEPADLVVHKSTRECPMIQPHPRTSCGIVRAREANRDRADAERRGASSQPRG